MRPTYAPGRRLSSAAGHRAVGTRRAARAGRCGCTAATSGGVLLTLAPHSEALARRGTVTG